MFCRAIIVLFISIFLLTAPESRAAWHFALPPNYVNPVSGKRNHVFYVGEPVRFTAGAAAKRFEVRDYYGTLIEAASIEGAGTTRTFDVRATKPGWYKLYLFGDVDQGEPWRLAVGGTTFVIFRHNPNFPALPALGTAGGWHGAEDQVIRGVTGMGPQRLKVEDASKPDLAIQRLEIDIAIDQAMYLPFDPVRKRELLVAFPNGTSNTEGVRKIVDRFKNEVRYWEGKNEPDHTSTGTYAALFELRPFYQLVKSVDPNLKVVGPAVTTIGAGRRGWINDYLTHGKGYFDAFSFHAYNCVNGDPWLARQSLIDLQAQLNQHNLGGIEKWQTEQGYMAALYGSYQPRLQGRWTMLQMMIYEQHGIPKEHNHIWYDRSHGFWNVPAWWENEDNSLNPAASLMRVWSEELFGTTFSRAYDFGSAAQNRYLGNLFAGPGKKVAAFMSGGNPHGSIRLAVAGASSVRVVSPFGEESDLPVVNGMVALPVSELPSYVRLAQGQTCEVVPPAMGENVAAKAGVTIQTNGAATHPGGASIPNSTAKLVNGKLENWYYNSDYAWSTNVTTFPATVEITLPQAAEISEVILYAGVPWQTTSTLVDYELQYWNGTEWVLIERVTEPTKTWKVFTPPVRCTVDSFFSDRWIFEHQFTPVSTNKVRLVIHEATYGGGATQDVVDAGGQTGYHQAMLREIEIRRPAGVAAPQIVQPPTNQTAAPGDDIELSVSATGSGPLAYIWTRNGMPVANGSSPILQLTDAGLDAQGSYRVTVVNAGGSTTSAPAEVTMVSPFLNWAAHHFPPERLNDPAALMADDDDRDGYTNLAEFYLHLHPLRGIQATENGGLPALSLEEGEQNFIVLRFEANPQAVDVQVGVETRSMLNTGAWAGVQPDVVETPYPNPLTGNVVYRFKFHRTGAASGLYRLKFTTP